MLELDDDREAVSCEEHRVRAVDVVALVVAVEHDDDQPPGEGCRREPHGVDRAEPGVGDQHDDIG